MKKLERFLQKVIQANIKRPLGSINVLLDCPVKPDNDMVEILSGLTYDQ